MVRPIQQSSSALRALEREFENRARKITTDLTGENQSAEAILASRSESNAPAVRFAPRTEPAESDLPRDFAHLAGNRRAIEANLASIRAQNKMLGVLLDIKA